jgi:hypothetical protein
MIIWCRGREVIGSTVHRTVFNDQGLEVVDQPFFVAREADYEDYITQAKDAGMNITGPNWSKEDFERSGALFYEVLTD